MKEQGNDIVFSPQAIVVTLFQNKVGGYDQLSKFLKGS